MGVLDGIMKGAKGGASLGPEGAVAGAGIGLATALIQNIQANNLKKKAESAMPPNIDPRQASFLAELNQKRKAIDTGADFASGINTINQTNAGTNNAIVNSSGGDAGNTLQGLLQSEGVANQGKNNVIAQGQQQQMQYNSMFNDLNNKISARSLQLQMYRSQQARAEWAQKKQSASQNTMAGGAAATQMLGQAMNSGGGPSTGDMLSSEGPMQSIAPPSLPGGITGNEGLKGSGGTLDLSVLNNLPKV